jgi:GNAT superfamily N-acetyltransferase
MMFTPERRDQVIDHELPLRQLARQAPAPLTGQRLTEADEGRVLAHLQALSAEDRRSRFGHGVNDAALQRWVAGLDWQGQWLWHPHTASDPVQALMHLAPAGPPLTWEVGLSVDPALRGQGWGRLLMTHALDQARAFTPGGRLQLHGSALNPALAKLVQAGDSRLIDGELHVRFQL